MTETGSSETHQWYVVYSKPHKEELAEFHLRLKGIHVFLPRLMLPGYVGSRRRVVPMFPNYLFVRLNLSPDSLDDYHHVRWTPGVKHFVSLGGVPTPLDDEVVSFLMRRADGDGVVAARSNLAVGHEVRIIGGPFEGLVAIIQNPPNAKGRVKVLLEILRSRPVNVDLPIHFVQSSWVV